MGSSSKEEGWMVVFLPSPYYAASHPSPASPRRAMLLKAAQPLCMQFGGPGWPGQWIGSGGRLKKQLIIIIIITPHLSSFIFLIYVTSVGRYDPNS